MTWVEVTVLEVVQETPLDRSLLLAVPPEARADFAFVPGQHLVLRDPRAATARDWHFSLSAAPNAAGTVRVTVRGRGAARDTIYAVPSGATLHARPPAGRFHVAAAPGEGVVLLAAGSGVTPFRAFVEQERAAARRVRVWLLQWAREAHELLFHDELRGWAEADPAFTYVPSLTGPDPAWGGRRGRLDDDLLVAALAATGPCRVYACGPGGFVDDALARAQAHGVPPARCLREVW